MSNPTEAELVRRALERPCPLCSAPARKRCRALGTASHVARKPHPERVAVAWREMLASMASTGGGA